MIEVGTRVHVRFSDIVACLHSTESISPVESEALGWVARHDDKVLELVYCRYDGLDERDGIAIPAGCVTSVEAI